MVARHCDFLRQSAKEYAVGVQFRKRLFPVHQRLRVAYLAAERKAHGLLPEANTEERNLAAQLLNHFDCDARILRTPRSGRQDNGLRALCRNFFDRQRIISDNLHLTGKTADQLVEVIGKAVVVVN